MFDARLLSGFGDVATSIWSSLFAGRLEAAAYFRACEAAAPRGAALSVVAVFRGEQLVAACPLFVVHYASEMPWSAGGAWLPEAIRHYRLPLRLHGLGSPLTDTCPLVVAPDLSPDAQRHAVDVLLSFAIRWSGGRLLDALLIKDVDEQTDAWLGPIARSRGFSRIETLPSAVFALTFADEAAYMASLPRSVAKYVRHRLKKAAGVIVDVVTDVAALGPELVALYRTQQAAAKTDSEVFDAIGDDFFGAIHRAMPQQTLVLAYRINGKLVGFMFGLVDGRTLATKYVGFLQPEGRDHSLYFLNWMTVLRYCLANGLRHIHVGQNSYAVKAMLGCSFERRYIYCRHVRRVPNFVVRQACKHISFANIDEELVALGASAPYATSVTAPTRCDEASPA
jgi:hypothetical protein